MDREVAREKLLNAIVFFVTNTRNCYKLKLFKLLFYFDFGIYRQTGRSVTGLRYFAWPLGPVPNDLVDELKAPRPDFARAVFVHEEGAADPDLPGPRLMIRGRKKFDETVFTQRELDMLEHLADVFRDATASMMTEATHLAGEPWHHVFKVERRPQAEIPYRLALDEKPGSITAEQADQIEREEREAVALFQW